ncbi:hypothetical protein E2C01_028887 [Portunus trituberculatus]|uniref:Uncharacterized protein n=1 Tax=Portunus trituberculatus TaxID=210409 RepID=A0A5B7ER97_PORTR|nr:hypothetical protein [Portunus trituberculatus]
MDRGGGVVVQLSNIVVSVELCAPRPRPPARRLAAAPGHIGPRIFQWVTVHRARVDLGRAMFVRGKGKGWSEIVNGSDEVGHTMRGLAGRGRAQKEDDEPTYLITPHSEPRRRSLHSKSPPERGWEALRVMWCPCRVRCAALTPTKDLAFMPREVRGCNRSRLKCTSPFTVPGWRGSVGRACRR